MKKIVALLLSVLLSIGMLVGCVDNTPVPEQATNVTITEDGSYTSKEEVAAYIATYDIILRKKKRKLWDGKQKAP